MKITDFYLQRKNDSIVWEEVDQFTWDNWDKAIDKDGGPRYSGNRVARVGNQICISATLEPRDLAVISRFLGVRDIDAPGSVRDGFVRRPEYVKFKVRNKNVLHELHGGDYVYRIKKETVENETG